MSKNRCINLAKDLDYENINENLKKEILNYKESKI